MISELTTENPTRQYLRFSEFIGGIQAFIAHHTLISKLRNIKTIIGFTAIPTPLNSENLNFGYVDSPCQSPLCA